MRASALLVVAAGCGGGVFSAAAGGVDDGGAIDGSAPLVDGPEAGEDSGDGGGRHDREAAATVDAAGDVGWDGHCTPLPSATFGCGATSCALGSSPQGCWLGAADAGGNRCVALGAWCACVETYGCGCVGYPTDCRALPGGGMVVGP